MEQQKLPARVRAILSGLRVDSLKPSKEGQPPSHGLPTAPVSEGIYKRISEGVVRGVQ